MDKTPKILELEALLDFSFEQVINPEEYLQSHYPQSYREVMSAEEEMVRTYHSKRIFVNDAQEIIGINLFDCPIAPDKLQELCALELPALQSLNLGKTGLTQFRFSSAQPMLVYVDLGRNESLKQVEFSAKPIHLKLLDIPLCRVQELVIPAGLEALGKMDVSRNEVLTRCNFLGSCPQLQHLDLSKNKLTEFHLPKGFSALQFLFLHDNQLTDFSFAGSLPSLLTLHLRANQLKDLPNTILDLDSLESLYLYDNPWDRLKEVISTDQRGNSKEVVFSYLTSLQGEVRFVNEGKMILVGNGLVGKTSIRRRLINKKAPLTEEEERTQGIEIDTYVVPNIAPEVSGQPQSIDFLFHIWDFGGQGRYREIQQLFCSYKALYLFVTAYDDKPEEKGEEYVSFSYWLNMVNSYGFNEFYGQFSPIILVINKIDEQDYTLKDRFIESFDHIHPEEIHVSAKTLENFPRLEETIEKILPKISPDVFTTRLHVQWIAVKEELLKNRPQNYLSYTQFQYLCEEKGLSPEDGRALLRILNSIGTIIYFGEHSALKDWVILNPEWIRDAMFKVIDSQLLKGTGKFRGEQVDLIWTGEPYSSEECTTFLELMKAYKLCYAQTDASGREEYVVPACLPRKQPILPWDLSQPDFHIRMKYSPFIPAGTVNKLIVELKREEFISGTPIRGEQKMGEKGTPGGQFRVFEPFVWRNNVIVQDLRSSSYAHVEEDWGNNQIVVKLFGIEVYSLYHYLYEILNSLNEELKATKYLRDLHIRPMGFVEGEWVAESLWEKLGFMKVAISGNQSIKDTLLQCIGEDKIEEAWGIIAENLPPTLKGEAVLLKARWSSLESIKDKDVVAYEELKREKNIIRESLISLLNKWEING